METKIKKRKELSSEAKLLSIRYKGQDEKTGKAIQKLMGKSSLMWD